MVGDGDEKRTRIHLKQPGRPTLLNTGVAPVGSSLITEKLETGAADFVMLVAELVE